MTSSLKSRILEGIALPSSERHVVGFEDEVLLGDVCVVGCCKSW